MLQVNTVYHGDFIKSFIHDFKDKSVDLFLFDPPYGLNYLNDIDYNDSPEIFDWIDFFDICWTKLKDTGNLLIFTGWTNTGKVERLFEGYTYNNRIVWDRQKYKNGGNNFPNSIEDILWFSKTKDRTFNKIESNIKKVTKGFGTKNGRENRVLTNCWSDIPPLVPWSQEYKIAEGYKGQKPVVLMERIIKVFTNENDLIVDGFCGSGSTAVASLNLNRYFIVCDKSKKAIQITKRRIKERI